MSNFVFYKLSIQLLTNMLGTCTKASIYDEHILKRAQKMIKKANALHGKVTKQLDKYVGTEPISPTKELEELKGIVRQQHEILGRTADLPDDAKALLEYSEELQGEIEKLSDDQAKIAPTIFMRDEEGHPMISSHMIVGNLKENLRISVNNSTSPKEAKPVKSKVAVGEMLALDVKPVEEFLRASEDVVRGEDGKPEILERPIVFEQMGKKVTSISRSEQLPAGTEFECVLRIRADSPFAATDAKLLRQILDYGKSNGMGKWRGSGGRGQFCFKLEEIKEDPTKIPEGWS